MHLGRFHKAIDLLADDFTTTKHIQLFENLINALNGIASNPGNAEQATVYKNQLEAFRQALLKSELNNPRPVLQVMLESIEAQKFIGEQLFHRVMGAISSNPAAPTLAVQELQKLKESTSKFFQLITSINNAFTHLGVEYEDLNPGEGELGILIPREDNSSSLKNLSKEFNEWSNALSSLTELFDPEAGPLQIRTCATTDWMIYLAASYGVLSGVSDCLKAINQILRELIEGRNLIDTLIAKKSNTDAIKLLEEENKNKLSSDIRILAEELVDQNYKGNDEARKNELKNAVDSALTQIAKKITQGSKIEMKFLPHERPEIDDPEDALNLTPEQEKEETLALRLDTEIGLLNFSATSKHVTELLEMVGQKETEAKDKE
jgi:hypothetical protein